MRGNRGKIAGIRKILNDTESLSFGSLILK
jgi:hypothetical protein